MFTIYLVGLYCALWTWLGSYCSGLVIVVPKQDGTWRVITHLSAPGGHSINDYIDPEAVTLSYTTVDSAVEIAQRLGRGTFLAKIDLKRAFRQESFELPLLYMLGAKCGFAPS